MTNIDFTEDNNPDIFLHLNSKHLIPDYVMDSDCINKEACAELSDVAFADPFNRRYPCHTKSACWQSAAHLAGRHVNDPEIRKNIEKQAAIHGIEKDVEAVFNEFEPPMAKQAAEAPQDQYALSIDYQGFGGRDVENYYPINSSFQCVSSGDEAADDFRSGRLPLPYMRKAAKAILEAAHAHDVAESSIHPVIIKYGAVRLPDPRTASSLLYMRKNAGINPEPYADILLPLVDEMEKAASVMAALDMAENAAYNMFMLDRQNHVKYGSNCPDPYSLLFCGPTMEDMEKAAATHVTILGVHVPVADFLNMSDKRINAKFNKQAAACICEAKNILSGEPTMEKTAAAEECLNRTLSVDNCKILLKELADTCF